jgi:hypothetical protein
MGSHANRQNHGYVQQGIIARAEKFFYPTSIRANRSRNRVLLGVFEGDPDVAYSSDSGAPAGDGDIRA